MISRVLEATLEDLLELETDSSLSPELKRYVTVLIAFNNGDRLTIARVRNNVQAEAPQSPTLPLIEMREQYLAAKPDLSWAASLCDGATDRFGEWEGEFWSLYGSLLTLSEKHEESRAPFRKAIAGYLKIGAVGRALRAEYNSICALGNIDPTRRLIPEFRYFWKKAKKHRQWGLAATALLNLSREHQKMGALKTALKLCKRAVVCTNNEVGSLTHFLVIAQRAHLHFQLKRPYEASLDLEYARTAKFPQIQAACRVLEESFAEELGRPVDTSSLRDLWASPSWKDRLEALVRQDTSPQISLSPTEEKLLTYIIESPRDRFEIYDYLFGKDVDPFKAENHVKNLLGRIRKKYPGLIVLENEKYRLVADNPDLDVKRKTGS